ncbi:PREDICTED: adenylate kinase 8 [Nicrophorus vespilloides]|uniref:Adenylate kinase 8 n=1 Tax=Nicrophorus vespilloides TaxID=110193 RepID=A0ABM1MNH7_NICVS|nr:PREDICTED: adenylate kinase 8 [Nicrophorus vespilloides]
MTDGTKRKITMPTWHMPYLEKHNIYKLFSEIARELVIQQPEDHVFFMKFLLSNAVKSVKIPKVIVLASPKVNVLEVAKQIVHQTQQILITESTIMEMLKKKFRDRIKPKELAYGLQMFLHTKSPDIAKNGWLLVDCIRSKNEAQRILDLGILPSHVIYLISPFSPKLTDLLYCNVTEHWPEYRRNFYGIREVFKKKLNEIHLEDFLIHDVVSKCVELISIERIEDGPKQPRIVLLGPRGCGRKTQARLLQSKLDIIHIDFEYLLCQAWHGQDELGEKLRSFGDKACFESQTLVLVLNRRLLDCECLKQGWILTGFPFNVKDFKFFDCVETPPNRVIFLECDLNICFERLTSRRYNVDTGSVTKLEEDLIMDITAKRLGVHPKDKSSLIQAELQYYCTNYGAMRKYAGGTASVVNADQPERWVHESITAAIMRDIPICIPRDPFEGDEVPCEPEIIMPYKFFKHD